MAAKQPKLPFPGGLTAGRRVRVEGEADGPPKRPKRGGPAREPIDEALRESEQRFRAVVEQVGDAFLLNTREGRILDVNQRACESLGYTREELLSMTLADVDVDVESHRHRERFWESLSLGESIAIEGAHRRKDGTTFPVEVRACLVEWGGERLMLGLARDVTERKRAEGVVREGEERLRAVAEGSPIPTFAIDRDHRVIAWNHALEEYTGVSAADALGSSESWRGFYASERPCMADLIVDGAADQIAAWYGETCDRSSVVRGAYQATAHFPRMKDGCWLFLTAAPLYDTDGQIIGAVETLQDVTEARRAEHALRKSEQRFHQVAENAQEWIWETDADGRYTYASVAVRQILGYEPEEVVGRKHFYDLFHPEDAEELKRTAIEAFAEKRAFREFPNRAVHKNGTEVWLLTSAMPLLDDQGKLLGYRGADIDVTERKRAEEALRTNEERYRLAQRLSGVGTWEWNVVTGEVYWSDEVLTIWGFRPGQFCGTFDEVVGAIHPDDAPSWREDVRGCVEDGREHDIEFRIIWPDGTVRWVASAGDAERDPDGKAVRMLGVVMDVTNRRRTEKLLENERRRLFTALNRIPGFVALQARDYSIPFANALFVEMFGDPSGRPCYEVYHGRSEPCEVCPTFRVFETNERQVWEFTAPHNRTYRIYDEPFPGDGEDDATVLEMAIDITDLKQAEEEVRKLNQELERRVELRTMQLRETNKELEAFAHSASHDLRAPLRHISGFAHLLDKHAVGFLDQPGRRYLDNIIEAADQMGMLIDDLLAFSRMGRAELRAVHVDLRGLVEAVIRDVEPDLRGRKVEWHIEELPTVLGDPSMLRQVLANLLFNAVKFTANRAVARIDVRAREEAGEVVVSVSDNGVGFDAKYVDKLFGLFQRLHREEDFPGTGVGLANVRRIVHRHGGRTWAEGAVDRGATFHFSLPRQR